MKTISAKFPSPTEAWIHVSEEKLGQDPSAQGRSLGLWQRLADRLTGWDQVTSRRLEQVGHQALTWREVTDVTEMLVKAGRRTEFSLKGTCTCVRFSPISGVVDPLRTLLDLHLELTLTSRGRGIHRCHHPRSQTSNHSTGLRTWCMFPSWEGDGVLSIPSTAPSLSFRLKVKGRRMTLSCVKNLRRQSTQLTQLRLSRLTDLLRNFSVFIIDIWSRLAVIPTFRTWGSYTQSSFLTIPCLIP